MKQRQPGQMEMGLAGANECGPGMRRGRRASRAHWWFTQMRQVAEEAHDWEPVAEPRFEVKEDDGGQTPEGGK